MSHAQEQKTIAKNTVFLYMRMIVIMAISLYTSRVVLDKLGVDDFGIYNIVGSVVVSFAFVKNSIMSAIQRFLSYYLGKDKENVSSVFSMSMNIQVIIVLFVAILLETVGLWFIYHVIKIPPERFSAGVITYHISVATFCVNLLRIPYLSLIVSSEKMSVYSVLSIVDAGTKLLIVYALSISDSVDKLILYALLILGATIIDNLLCYFYCKAKLNKYCDYRFIWDKGQFKEILSFTSWNLFGGVAGVASTEGPNYFMNYYLGVGVNAAMGVAKQVNNAVCGFFYNFQTAFNPQIVKSYAAKEYDYMFDLIFRTSKLSFFLVYVVAIPFIVCCEDVLNLWLTVVPDYTAIFSILFLIAQMVSAVSSPLWMSAHAIGNIRNYQLMLCGFNLAVIPISWIVLSLGYEPYWILVAQVLLNVGILVYRVEYLYKKIHFPHGQFYREVVLRLLILFPIITLPLIYLFSTYVHGFIGIVIVTLFSCAIIGPLFYLWGLNKGERQAVLSIVKGRLNKKMKR